MIKKFIDLAHSDGVSHEENFPFWIEPEAPSRAGIVLVHGFSATPREMRPLAEALVEKGFSTLGVRLPGHGTSPEDLSRRRYDEWVATVGAAIDITATRTGKVYAAGLSTGSLALLAASRNYELSGMVLLAPFLRLHHPLAPYVWFLRHLVDYEERNLEPELATFYYARRPLRAVHQLLKLMKRVRSLLPMITAPSLVLTTEGDTTADHDSAIRLFEKLGSPNKRLQLFGPEVPHAMLGRSNPRRDEVIRESVEFFLELEKKAEETRQSEKPV